MLVKSLFRSLAGLGLALTMSVGALGVFHPVPVFAADDALTTVGNETGLGAEDPKIIVGNIIRTALGVLGIILVVVVIYGGFVWMTAQGDPEKVDKAKKILVNAVIGLIIILLSWSIATFVIRALTDATGGTGGGGGGGGSTYTPGLGGGSSTGFVITGFSPDGAVSIRNIQPRITFNRAVDAATVDGNVTITDAAGVAVSGAFTASGNTVKFTPDTPCPEPDEDRFCFAENTSYIITATESVLSTEAEPLDCSDDACSATFTSGTIVDTEDPDVSVTYPESGENVASASWLDVQALATDNAGLSSADFSVDDVWYDSIPAAGALTETFFSANISTESFVDGEYYMIEVTAFDLAGNEDSDDVRVRARPAMCFNGVLDTSNGETDIDCGGESSSASYCGACDGSSCTENSECSSGSCSNGACQASPSITGVAPQDGAPGTYVTITGTDFGSATGTVLFVDDVGTGTVVADVLACGDGWSDTQIVVAVPEGASDGPITITTSAGTSDATDDANGAAVPNFDINDVEHPSLCELSEYSGVANDALTIDGANFGNARGSSMVYFSTHEAGSYTAWSDASVGVTVPSTNDGIYEVFMVENGITSNTLYYSVVDEVQELSTITTMSPTSGGIGQYVTISGTNFGSGTGTVKFTSGAGAVAIASVDFPDECADDIWDTDQVTVIVPEEFQNGDPLTEGRYDVTVTSSTGVVSTSSTFTVTNSAPTPGICALNPEQADVGESVTIYGDNFGGTVDLVTFHDGVSTAAATTWTNDMIVVPVPAGAATGPLSVTVAGVEGNEMNFAVGASAGTVTAAGVQAAYAWSFSTGDILDVPRVVRACTEDTVSAVPNNSFSSAADICVNAVVYAEFTTLMNEATVESAVLVERCTAPVGSTADDPCATTEPVAGFATADSSASATRVTWTPAGAFSPSTTYQVTIDTTALSTEGVALASAEMWEFTTSSSTAQCVVDRVTVSPSQETLTEEGATTGFGANAGTGCVVVDSADYTWDWSVNSYSFVDFTSTADDACTGDPTACATVEALAEGTTVVTATALNAAGGGNVSDSADVVVNFSDPYVLDYWPNCTEACTNAAIRAEFNTAMNATDITTGGNIALYQCASELCTALTLVDTNPDCVYSPDDATRCIGFDFGTQSLAPSKFYRVVVSGDITSTSGVALIRTNYGPDFSWTFRVREDATACAVERITVSPENIVADAIGDRATFTATAYGGSDSCSVSGQPLAGDAYNWTWTNPIDDAEQNASTDEYTAAWYTISSALLDGGISAVAEGCSALCTPIGSAPYQAVCGDGTRDQDANGSGEECDDGNTTDHDGCSSTCLYEGSVACAMACSGSGATCTTTSDCAETCDTSRSVCTISGTACTTNVDCPFFASTCGPVGTNCCGNRTIETASDIAEDCDDGNMIDGDGCSASCIAEGSTAVGATCGNNDIAYDTVTGAGEECDDGNNASGDGCSRQCLREGSQSLASLGGALCGDGAITPPYESCDDGNTVDNDGCSSSCVREGLSACALATDLRCCGNGIVDVNSSTGAGEDCDGGDGCSSQCTLLGSSIDYAAASVCGDGVVGDGELAQCELGSSSGDGNTDPNQVAYITDDAVYEVSTETQKAIAKITVTEPSSNFTATVDYTLSCAAQSDQDCSDPTMYGVGAANCCALRPTMVTAAPSGAEVCRNAAMYAIFSTEMDTSSFSEAVKDNDVTTRNARMYARLNLGVNQTCPARYTSSSEVAQGWIQRAIGAIRTFFLGPTASAASSTDCIVPVGSYIQSAMGDGTYKVSMTYTEALEANSSYTLVIEGDENTGDEVTQGVRSSVGAGMNGTASIDFTTGTDVCSIDVVQVNDLNEESPGVYTQAEESHDYLATALSYDSGSGQEIVPLTGVYDWEWSAWTAADETLFTAVQNSSAPANATVTAVGDNGESTITVVATITADTVSASTGEMVSGNADVTAFLCENPWPALASYPWSDDATGEANGFADSGATGYMNFATSYCRDAGADNVVTDDLPSVDVVLAPASPASGVLKEYLFEIDADSSSIGSDSRGDAIGVRVMSNPEYLSPMAWYTAKGFRGSPSDAEVDGFAAVIDDRSTYVAAANSSAAGLYSNMYIISYNEGATEETKDIYQQMLANISFLLNVPDVRVCVTSGNACTSDFDCSVADGEACGSDKLKILRDTKRIADLQDIVAAVETYGEENGTCSATSAQACVSDSECPSGETCVAGIPALASGTAVRGLASSAWSSWSSTLGGAIGDGVPVDPLNRYASCDGYSSDTCVNATTGAYVCPAASHVYHFRAVGSRAYELAAELEYTAKPWVNPIDPNTTDAAALYTSSYCDGDVYGTSSVCGDGIIGVNSNNAVEVCEIGDVLAQSCTMDSGDAGTANAECNSTCSGYTLSDSAVCSSNSCGDGVVNGTEICDDGAMNGEYGYCGATCTWDEAMYCGDGVVSGGEACDCGDATADVSALVYARPYGGSPGACVGRNGTYGSNANTTCGWDCSGAASFCGDNTVDSGEVCDGTMDAWAGALCSDGVTTCSSDSDCPSGFSCGSTIGQAACPVAYVCQGGSFDGQPCAVESWPTSVTDRFSSTTIAGRELYYQAACSYGGGTCVASGQAYQTEWTRGCDDTDAGAMCGWNVWSACNYNGQFCGNGVVDGSEQCDDGNDVATDGCTTACTVNVCGDGYLYDGEEECDEGSENGGGCDSAYGSTCTSCTTSCSYTVSSGEFCGDGVQDSEEYCDGADVPYVWFDVDTMATNGTCETLGTTWFNDDDDITYTCKMVGTCNGGSTNGAYCTQGATFTYTYSDDAACGADSAGCVMPVCGASCESTCPTATQSAQLLMLPNLPGSATSSNVDLYSYDASSSSDLPNVATITVPACTVAGNLKADVSFDGVTQPDTYVVFVTDTSGSMATALGSSTRMQVAIDSVNNAIGTLYEELEEKAHIGLVHYASSVTTDSDFVGPESEFDLQSLVQLYTATGATQTDDALIAAKTMLDGAGDVTNVNKIIILLSDGMPDSESATDAAVLDILKTSGYELYSITVNTSTDLIATMNGWSSNTVCADDATSMATGCVRGDYNPDTLFDYSYAGDTVSEVEGAYEQIIDSIMYGSAVLLSSNDGVISVDRGTVSNAHNIDLPWPSGFACDGVTEAQIPIQITFRGEGTINVSNVRVEYCAP